MEASPVPHWRPADRSVAHRRRNLKSSSETASDLLAKALDQLIVQCRNDANLRDFCMNYREELENFAAHLTVHCKEKKFVGVTVGVFRAWVLVMHFLFEHARDDENAMHIWGKAMTEVINCHHIAIWPARILIAAKLNPFAELSYLSVKDIIDHRHADLMNALYQTERQQRARLLSGSKRFGDEKMPVPELITVLQRTNIRDSRYLDFCIQHDLWFPMSFLLFRNARVRAGVLIGALGGGRLGNTFIGKVDIDMGSNMHQKTIQWHMSLWMKAHVLNDKAAVVHRGVMVKGYHGGLGHTFYEYNDDMRNDYQEGRINPREADIFCCIVPLNYRMNKEYIHLNGYPDPRKVMYSDRSYQLDYPTAIAYRDYWGWKYVDTESNSSNLPHAYNMVMWQGHSLHFKHTGKGRGSFDYAVICKSPFGERVYPGCGKIREGHGVCYRQPVYLGNTAVQLGV